jgi:hypothetical protein
MRSVIGAAAGWADLDLREVLREVLRGGLLELLACLTLADLSPLLAFEADVPGLRELGAMKYIPP